MKRRRDPLLPRDASLEQIAEARAAVVNEIEKLKRKIHAGCDGKTIVKWLMEVSWKIDLLFGWRELGNTWEAWHLTQAHRGTWDLIGAIEERGYTP